MSSWWENLSNVDPDKLTEPVPISKGGTGVTTLDYNYFDTSNNKLSLKINSISPWGVNNNNTYYNNGNVGNVGIGTSLPTTKLDVRGDISANNYYGSGFFLNNLNANNINGQVPIEKGGTGVSALDYNYFDISNNKLSLKLNSISPWSVNNNYSYYNNGSVGIGTSIPTTKLDVRGDISANNYYGSGSNLTNLNINNLNGQIPIARGGTGVSSLFRGQLLVGNDTNNMLQTPNLFWDNNSNRLQVIGDISTNRINVTGDISANRLQIRGDISANRINVTGDISANNYYGSGYNLTNLNFSNFNGQIPITRGGTGVSALINGQLLVGNPTRVLQTPNLFWDNSLNRLQIIGDISANRINVTGDISANRLQIRGDISANRINVTGDISANNFYGSGSNLTNLNPNNINGTVPFNKGGTGVITLANGQILIGNGPNGLRQTPNLFWDNSLNRLQVSGDISANFYGSASNLTNLNPNNINGTVPFNKGGTGVNSLINGQILIGNGPNGLRQTPNLLWDNSLNRLQVAGDISGNNNLCLNDKCINYATLSNLIDFAKYLNDIKVINGIPILGMAGSGQTQNSPAGGKYTIISNGLTLPNENLTFVAPISNRVQAKFRFGIKEINGITKYATIKNSSNNDMIAVLEVNNTDNPQVKVYFIDKFINNLSLSLAVLERERLVNNISTWVVVDTRQITSNTLNILYSITDTAFKN